MKPEDAFMTVAAVVVAGVIALNSGLFDNNRAPARAIRQVAVAVSDEGVSVQTPKANVKVEPAKAEASVEIVKPQPEKAPTPAGIEWYTDYNAAVAESKRTGKPLLVVVSLKSGCPPCELLKRTTLKYPSVVEYVRENCIACLDETQQVKFLANEPRPVVWVRSPDGKTGWRLSAWRDADVFRQQLERVTK